MTTPILRGQVEKIVDGGWGLVRTGDRVVFLSGVIPGETVDFSIREIRNNLAWGDLLQVLTSSPHRISAPCPYYLRCGGCAFQHISYDHQRRIKREIFRENMLRIGGLAPETGEVVPSPPYGYRFRARFKTRDDGRIGFIRRGTHEVLPLSRCLLVKPRISDFLTRWNGLNQRPFAFQFDVLENREQLDIYLPHQPKTRDMPQLKKLEREGISFYWPGTRGKSISSLMIGEYDYLVSPAVFFQVNHFLWITLLDTLEKHLRPGKRALDLYSGVGFFIPLLRKYLCDITAVESHPFAAALLQKHFPHTEVHQKTAEKAPLPPADLLIADPPRSGLSRRVLRKILNLRYPRIIYISCNAATLARDCGTLVKDGPYRIDQIDLLDLFPQTPHLESITLLIRI